MAWHKVQVQKRPRRRHKHSGYVAPRAIKNSVDRPYKIRLVTTSMADSCLVCRSPHSPAPTQTHAQDNNNGHGASNSVRNSSDLIALTKCRRDGRLLGDQLLRGLCCGEMAAITDKSSYKMLHVGPYFCTATHTSVGRELHAQVDSTA
ncbi:Uncharacterized protein HZ326_11019 [Fusarium oxysporum f. sp. albedinis]|nr:Uncharacterized protein HZ326_11019 [Fusarium oxysporum f. sp. albedinis]